MYRLLHIDDNTDEQFIFSKAVATINASVEYIFVPGADEALEFLNRNKSHLPSLILLDLNMPGVSGIEFLKTLRSKEENKNIPVAIFTGMYRENDRVESIQHGANYFLVKNANSPKELVEDISPLMHVYFSQTEPFYSSSQNVYHNNIRCTDGRTIKKEESKPGTGDRSLCQSCAKFNQAKRQFLFPNAARRLSH